MVLRGPLDDRSLSGFLTISLSLSRDSVNYIINEEGSRPPALYQTSVVEPSSVGSYMDFGLLPKDFVQVSNIHSILNRGCAYNCIYCAERQFWGKPRSYTIEKITRRRRRISLDTQPGWPHRPIEQESQKHRLAAARQ